MIDLSGHSIGRYQIVERRGEGGMAVVYRAFDLNLEAEVAIKFIRTDHITQAAMETTLKRFQLEARRTARLTHPNIIAISDYGEYSGIPYLVMKYMPGGTLKEHFTQPVTPAEAARLLAPIARALQYAHQQGILHRDVKPSNILLADSGEPVLADFGIAKILEGQETSVMTSTGVGMGTPAYMAPEQWLGQAVPASDQYGLGVVFYELITGRPPYEADTPAAVMLKQATEPLPRPSLFVPGIPDEAERVIFKSLARNPADRYADMTAMAQALDPIARGEAAKPPEPAAPYQAPAAASAPPALDMEPALPNQAAQFPAEPAAPEKIENEPIEEPDSSPPSPTFIERVKNFWLWVGVGLVGVILLLYIAFGAHNATPSASQNYADAPTVAPTLTAIPPTSPAAVASTVPATGSNLDFKPVITKPPDCSIGKTYNITIWHPWTGPSPELIQQVFTDYQAAYPCVTVTLTRQDNMTSALSAAFAANKGPDIIGWTNDNIGMLAKMSAIKDLDSLGVTQDYLKSTFEPAAAKGVVWNAKIWAIPVSQEGIALIYNKDLVEDKYLPGDPMNFDDLLAKAEQFTQDKNKPLLCNPGFNASDAYHVAPIYFGFGVPSYVDDQGKVYLDTPEALKAAQWLQKLSKISPNYTTSYTFCLDAFKNQQVGILWTGPWALKEISDAKINFGIRPMGRPFVNTQSLMLTTRAVTLGNQDVALNIIEYASSAAVQKKLSTVFETIPASTEALKAPEVSSDPLLAAYVQALRLGVPMGTTPYATAQWGPVGDASQRIWQGKTPAFELAAAQKVIEAAISNMK